jgi:hypothetical protein
VFRHARLAANQVGSAANQRRFASGGGASGLEKLVTHQESCNTQQNNSSQEREGLVRCKWALL